MLKADSERSFLKKIQSNPNAGFGVASSVAHYTHNPHISQVNILANHLKNSIFHPSGSSEVIHSDRNVGFQMELFLRKP